MGIESGGVQSLGIYGEKLVVGGFQGVDRLVPGALGLVAWDGQWSGFGRFAGTPYTFCQLGSDLVVGGRLNQAGDQVAFGLARWGRGAPIPPINPDPPPPPPPPAPTEMYVRSTVVTDAARLRYSLSAGGRACIDVFDVRGARVATVMDREVPSGEGVLEWSAGSPPYPAAGVYFIRLTQNGKVATARIVFLR